MLDKGMVALGRVVLSKRERVIMLQPRGKGLLGATLRYPYEIRDEGIYFGDIGEIQIPKDMLALAEHILESKAAKFDPSKFHDRYEEAIVTMLNEKKAGMPIAKQRPMPRIVAGTDLMAALKPEHRQSERGGAEDGRQTSAAGAGRDSRGEAGSRAERQAGGEGQHGPARDAAADRGRRPGKGSWRARERRRQRNRRRKSPGRGRKRDSLSLQRAMNPIACRSARRSMRLSAGIP